MRYHHTRNLLIAGALALIVAFVGVSRYITSTQAQPVYPCGTSIENACGEEKITMVILQETADFLTARSMPYQTSIPPTPNLTATLNPPGYVPAEARAVKRLSDQDIAGVNALYGMTSVWMAGSVVEPDGSYDLLSVWASPPSHGQHAQIGLFMMNAQRPGFDQAWEVPHDVGTITITNITGDMNNIKGPRGVIAFETSTGKVGTLDTATGAWTFTPQASTALPTKP